MIKEIFRKSWWIVAVWIFIFCYYYLIQVISSPEGLSRDKPIQWEGIFFIFLVSLFSIGCVHLVKKRLDRKPTQNILSKYLKLLLYSFLLFIFITAAIQVSFEYAIGQRRSLSYIIGNGIIYVFLHIIIGNAYIAFAYFRESASLRQYLLLTEKAQMESELKVLQQQMNPHFLFNNLNTLTSLIDQNPEKAIAFTKDLSEVMRYVSQNSQKDFISLQEEIDFLTTYMELMHSRLGKAYMLVIEIGKLNPHNALIIPMTLQLLIENVIKHNSGSRSEPLQIELSADEESLYVKNEIRKKRIAPHQESGLGLKNLQERYLLTTGKNISPGEKNGYFEVKIPIIKKIKDESFTH
jgi:sensor histidine kinase YesM